MKIRDRAQNVKHQILAIGKALQRRTGEAVDVVRRITETLARLGEAPSRVVARLLVTAKAQVAAGQTALQQRIARVEQALGIV